MHRTQASLLRSSVLEFAWAWQAVQALRAEPKTRLRSPPDNSGHWIDTETAAAMLACSMGHVRVMAQDGRLPSRLRGRKRWFLETDVELMSRQLGP